MSTDHEASGDYGDQLMLDGLGVRAGERYQNIHSDTIVTVTEVKPGRRAWVQFRRLGHETEQPLDTFLAHHRLYVVDPGHL